MFYNIGLISFLIFFWIINSSIFNLFFFIIGGISVVLTYNIYYFLIQITEHEFNIDLHVYKKLSNILLFLKSIFYLFCDVIFYSIKLIMMIILNKKVESSILKINFKDIKCNFQLMIATHAITMTPGSISIFQDDRIIYVHCFDKYHVKDIKRLDNDCDEFNYLN